MATTLHDTIRTEINLPTSRERAFGAWADPAELMRWYCPGDESWTCRVVAHEFRVGGLKQLQFGPPDETMLEDCRYEDIVPGRRICFSMTISRGDSRISTSMVTVELEDEAGATRCRVTDQLVTLDGLESAQDRTRGWAEVLGKLEDVIAS
jgi:uncharacterized protein YndB with AHSA1/START domain